MLSLGMPMGMGSNVSPYTTYQPSYFGGSNFGTANFGATNFGTTNFGAANFGPTTTFGAPTVSGATFGATTFGNNNFGATTFGNPTFSAPTVSSPFSGGTVFGSAPTVSAVGGFGGTPFVSGGYSMPTTNATYSGGASFMGGLSGATVMNNASYMPSIGTSYHSPVTPGFAMSAGYIGGMGMSNMGMGMGMGYQSFNPMYYSAAAPTPYMAPSVTRPMMMPVPQLMMPMPQPIMQPVPMQLPMPMPVQEVRLPEPVPQPTPQPDKYQYRVVVKSSDPRLQAEAQRALEELGPDTDPERLLEEAQRRLDHSDGADDGKFQGARIVASHQDGSVTQAQPGGIGLLVPPTTHTSLPPMN